MFVILQLHGSVVVKTTLNQTKASVWYIQREPSDPNPVQTQGGVSNILFDLM